jgi:hypothetical protein
VGAKGLRGRIDAAFAPAGGGPVSATSGGALYDLHRATAGFETTLFDGRASVGARVPFLYRDGGNGPAVDGLGDITLVAKYVLLADCARRNVLSAGLAVTIPTSRDLRTTTGVNLNDWLIQPWVGGLAEGERVYVQGFAAAVLPSVQEDTRLLTLDAAVGYKLYQCRSGGLLTAVIPTLEMHWTCPLDNKGIGQLNHSGIGGFPADDGRPAFANQLIVTAGSHFGLGERTWLTVAVGRPIVCPRTFVIEGVVQLNVGF